MSAAATSLAGVANLGDSLTALTQGMQAAMDQQGSALYFDYVGLTMFSIADVHALTQCVREMMGKGVLEARHGHGAVFLTVHAWPLSTDKARVTAQLAYSVTSGMQDLSKLSMMFRQPALAALDESPHMPSLEPTSLLAAFTEGVDADCVQHMSPGEGAVIELGLSLPHRGAEIEPAGLVDLATVSAWLIGALSEENALLAIRLQRDGWLVRQFADVNDALRFWASGMGGLEPALIIATEQSDVSQQVLADARGVWSPQCRVIHGVHADEPIGHMGARPQAIEVRKIPFSPADLREIKESASSIEATREEDSHLKKRVASRVRPTALVVDDNLVNRILASEMLHVLGYDSDTAENGRDAVEYLERYHPDVVLMDLEMPVMDGMEATERIRRYEMHGGGTHAPVPIIATTARDEPDVSRSWEAIGMSAFVPKPLLMRRLAEALSRHASLH